MTRSQCRKIGCVIALAVASCQPLCAQVVETVTSGPIVQTRPDDGSPIAATAGANIGFSLLRKLRTSVSIVTGYDDNVGTSGTGGSGGGSLYTNANANVSYGFGTARTRVGLSGGGGMTYYFDRPGSEYEGNAHFALSMFHKFSKRLTLSIDGLVSYQSQPDLSTDLGASQDLGSYVRLTNTNTLAFVWGPRYSTITSYTLGALMYDGGAGSLQNRVEQTFAQEMRFLLFPSTTVDGTYRFALITYETAQSDSTTHFLLGGFDHKFTPHLNASFRGGIEIRASDDESDGLAPHFESTVNYALGRRISVSWTNSYATEESTTPGGSAGSTFRTGLSSQIRITRRLTSTFNLNYTVGENNLLDFAPSFNIMLTSAWFVYFGYHFTNDDSDFGYSRNNYFFGMNFSF